MDQSLLTIFAAVAGSWSAMGTLGWWLSGQFRKTEARATQALASHEALDNQRHEDTLKNFGRIYVALARKGMPVVLNGDTFIDPPMGE
jgi:hypothetical protein